MPNYTLSREILVAALEGLEAEQQRLQSQIAEVRRLIGSRAGGPQPARRRMSAAARKRIREGQKKRWEAFHKAQEKSPAAAGTIAPKKRRLSAAGRAAIAAAARKRWAAARKQKAAPAKAAPSE